MCDLADYVEVLTADPATTVICLVVEKVRQPERFFAAVATARAAGKPVLALKLGRSDRVGGRAPPRPGVPFLVTSVESTSIGPWVESWRERNLVFARAVQSVYRAAEAMNGYLAPARAPGTATPRSARGGGFDPLAGGADRALRRRDATAGRSRHHGAP